MNQTQSNTSECSIGRAESGDEVKNKLLADYVESHRAKDRSSQRSSAAASVVEIGPLFFSVLDDLKLYGRMAIELEFATRQVDPYSWYKQQLTVSAQTVHQGAASESA
jgi:hypothetical protein